MGSRLNPYVNFPGTARQAMEFYKDVFGGTLSLSTFGDLGAQHSGGDADKIMHGNLETDLGFALMGADVPTGMEHRPGNTITVSISGDDEDKLRGYWEKLSEGGTVAVPFEKQMWGDIFGMCTDKFGVPWMVDIVQPRS
ncbi:MAG: VOC family protein [Actinocatenispora sp.]